MYTATISGAGLRLRESRVIADLLLRGLDERAWRRELLDSDVLHLGTESYVLKLARLLRGRLEPLGAGLWEMVRDGDRSLAGQATFAGAVKQSRLLGDFLDIALREQRRLFAERIGARVWNEYVEGCRGRDPDMPSWSVSTIEKLRSAVFSMMAAVGYIESTTTPTLRTVFVAPELRTYLVDQGERYVLRCLEVAE